MADDEDERETQAVPRRCFVVSAFGATGEEKVRTKQVLRHLIRKVLEPRGYDVVRADDIDDEGLITNQIIEHLLEDDLVVADLTGKNPNVFYEVAVRHAARKPIVHLITAGEPIPFDVANMRAVQYALDDPDVLEQAQQELERKVTGFDRGQRWRGRTQPGHGCARRGTLARKRPSGIASHRGHPRCAQRSARRLARRRTSRHAACSGFARGGPARPHATIGAYRAPAPRRDRGPTNELGSARGNSRLS